MSVHQKKDPAAWSPTYFVHYLDMEYFEEACNKAREQGLTIPVAVKWKNVLAGLSLLTPARAWFD